MFTLDELDQYLAQYETQNTTIHEAQVARYTKHFLTYLRNAPNKVDKHKAPPQGEPLHTPLPWTAWFNKEIFSCGIDTGDGGAGIVEIKVLTENLEYEETEQAWQQAVADANLIVRSCNESTLANDLLIAAAALLNCSTGAAWQTREIRDRAFRDLSAAVNAYTPART